MVAERSKGQAVRALRVWEGGMFSRGMKKNALCLLQLGKHLMDGLSKRLEEEMWPSLT